MQSTTDPTPETPLARTQRGLVPLREGLRAWAELTGIWALAVAYPLLTASVSGIEGLTSVRADWVDVTLFVLLAVFAVPTIGLLLEVAAGLVSTALRKGIHAGLLGLTASVFVLRFLVDQGMVGRLGVLLALLAAVLIALAWSRSDFLKSMTGILAISTPVVIVVFAISSPVAAVLTPAPVEDTELNPATTPPVVMLLIDEMPIAMIEKRPGVIDAGRFPNLARLSRQSTWYQNAISPSDSTVIAAPTLLAGKVPMNSDTPPGSPDYPDNFFTVLDRSGYDVYGNEWITDLCPHDVCPRTRGLGSRLTRLLTNGWEFGRPIPLPNGRDLREAALFRDRHDPLPGQAERVDDFVEAIEVGENSALLLHVMLPHVPWVYLPDGRIMNGNSATAELLGEENDVKGQLQRMMLQAEFLDSQIGRVIRTMKQAGIWEQSLFIAVADHGATMQAGLPRRQATPENVGWVLPVPLFIKYPGQPRGKTAKRPVSSSNLMPTFYEVLGLQPDDESLDPATRSLNSDQPPLTEVDVITTLGEPFSVPTAEVARQFRRAVTHVNSLFPATSIYVGGGKGNLLGEPVAGQKSLKRLEFTSDEPDLYDDVDLAAPTLPVFITGVVSRSGLTTESSLVIAVNDQAAGTTKPWESGGTFRITAIADPNAFRNGLNEVEIYRVSR